MSDDNYLPLYEAAWRATHKPSPGGNHRWRDTSTPNPATPETTLTQQVPQPPFIRHPRTSQPKALTAQQVAKAYNAPIGTYTGAGVKVGIIELGGAFSTADLKSAGVDSTSVTAVGVDGGKQQSDPQGADGEVALDIQVVAEIAPGATIRVYFAANTDQGFVDATKQAIAECDVVSVSWGGPENSWSSSSIKSFSAVLATARKANVPVFVAAGDSGSTDGTRSNVVDYPASDPNSIGCGGTRLTLNSDGTRSAEVVWNDDPTQSATGGGVSKVFSGRQVPDVAGNADPDSGYPIFVDGQEGTIGGTSAVAPLYAGCYALLLQAHGSRFDFLNLCTTNPSAMFDVRVGNNGGYSAGPGRDDVSGLGTADFGKLLAILQSGAQVPVSGGGGTTDGGTTTPTSTETPGATALLKQIEASIKALIGGS